jgi:ABC-type transport system involved in multi-copper enzyme maturation permease subunit
MRTVWQSLAWKEWHEHKWNFVSILAILCGVTGLMALTVDERNTLGAALAILLLTVVPLAMFIGMGAAAGERSRGTLPFLQALPVPMWRVALHKLVAGLVTVIVPFAIVVAATYGICQLLLRWEYVSPKLFAHATKMLYWTTGNWVSDSLLLLSYLALCFFIWTIGTGVNRKHEISAAAVALLTMLGWAVALMLAWKFIISFVSDPSLIERSPFNWIFVLGLSTLPGGLFSPFSAGYATQSREFLPLAILVAAAVLVALATRYVWRFGNISDLEIRSPMTANNPPGRLDWLGPPRSSAIASIAWKQFREGWPVALAGVAIIFGVFAATFVTHWRDLADNSNNQVELIHALTGVFGFVIAMILGVSVFSGDVSPGLNTFWRSRPIQPNLWFWIKFLSALAIAVAAIYLPLLLVAGLDGLMVRPELNVIRAAQIAIFAAAVLMICLVRQAVYAAILSIAVVYLGVVTAAMVRGFSLLIRGQGWPDGIGDLFDLSEEQVIMSLFATFVVSTLLAWLAVRNDWGQKSVR